MLGVVHGVLLWADTNAATPPGSRGRAILCTAAGPQHSCQPVAKRYASPPGVDVSRGKGVAQDCGVGSSWCLPWLPWTWLELPAATW